MLKMRFNIIMLIVVFLLVKEVRALFEVLLM
jgi:hypothetical protein